jgi:O-antigen/teichoic acid export membrane protein
MNLAKILNSSIFKNASSLTFNQALQVLIQLFFIPIYLTFWDLNTYSEWIIITTFTTLLAISEFGLASYGLNLTIILNKKNKIKECNETIQNVIFFSTLFISFTIFFILTLDLIFNFQKIFNITSIEESNFQIIIFSILFRYLIQSNLSFISGLYRINHKFHISNYIKSFFIITEIILIFIVLYNGGSILEVSFVSLFNYFFAFLIIIIFIKKEFKWLKILNLKNISKSFIKKIFYPSLSFMTGNVSKGFIAQITIIILNFFATDAFIIFYNSLRLIINGARQFINIISSSYYPEITILYGKKKFKQITKQSYSMLRYNFYLATFILIFFIFFIKEPFLIWTKNTVNWDFYFFIFFIFSNFIEWISIPILTLPYAINKAELLNKPFVITAFSYPILILLTIPLLNNYSIPVALLLINSYLAVQSIIKIKSINNIIF